MDQWEKVAGRLHARKNRASGEFRYQDAVYGAGGLLFWYGRQPAEFVRFAFLGLRAAQRHHWNAGADLYVAKGTLKSLGVRPNPRALFGVLERSHPSKHRAVEAVVPHFLRPRNG